MPTDVYPQPSSRHTGTVSKQLLQPDHMIERFATRRGPTMRQGKDDESAFRKKRISPAPLKLLGQDEPHAPTVLLSSPKRAALIACLADGTLRKQRGVWTSLSEAERRIADITVANLVRDGMLTLRICGRRGVVHLTVRGRWFARTIASARLTPEH